jgi:nucleoside-diphosphate-sugar epimerase
MLRVTIAGGSGFIGRHLIQSIQDIHLVNALSRSIRTYEHQNVVFKQTDLFSLTSVTEALKDTDVAIYLVHSMMPSSRLFQGNFHDTDLMLADNFLVACKENNVKQIIYLGGIVPNGHISKHLESRKEVESVLRSSDIPCTILRAGMVVGNGGSSFEILKNLVHTLPAMVLPKWTETTTQMVYLDDLINILVFSIDNSSVFDQTLDVVTGEKIKYRELIEQTKHHLHKKSFMIPVPINYTSFSKLWVSVFGKANYSLVSPLIDSLLCDFSEISPSGPIIELIKYPTYKSMLPHISIVKKESLSSKKTKHANNVRSIQRLPEQNSVSTTDIADKYMNWLPKFLKSFIKVQDDDQRFIKFNLIGFKRPLLILQYVPNDKVNDRAKFLIIGGLLTKTKDTGWLEFRNILGGKYLLASINEFYPSLPWFVYKFSQAKIHKLTMTRFGAYLTKQKDGES